MLASGDGDFKFYLGVSFRVDRFPTCDSVCSSARWGEGTVKGSQTTGPLEKILQVQVPAAVLLGNRLFSVQIICLMA